MHSHFWRSRRVFLTGHTGFKGSWLSLWLQNWGAEVVGYALPPPAGPSHFIAANVGTGMSSIEGDVRNLGDLTQAMKSAEPEIVIHLAAQALVRASYEDPVSTYATNVLGTVNVLEAVRATRSVRAVVNVTTDKCYENREWPWGYRETDTLGGWDPYSSSKACSELVTSAYRSSFFRDTKFGGHGVAIASARAGNVVGGGDWSTHRLVPDIVSALAKGKPVVVRNPESIRPWQHVLEPLSGYLTLAERLFSDGPTFSGAWNFGPRDEDCRSVRWIVEQLTSSWGVGAQWQTATEQGPHEAAVLKLDISKAVSQLGWRPRWGLNESLNRIVDWHRTYHTGVDMRALSSRQIADYIETKGGHENR